MTLFRPDLAPEDQKRRDDWQAAVDDRPHVLEFRESDGEVRMVNEAWPPTMLVADHLLDLVRPGYISTGDGMLRITVANGDALYGRVGDGPIDGTSTYEFIRGTVA